ncbi:hypothetical protein, partial [Arthrobacter sp. 754]|uniref:hypothetical protein n=1 Tax=Arthrobacter sp. 754 TaxID=3156315 RepID=UPI00339A3C33
MAISRDLQLSTPEESSADTATVIDVPADVDTSPAVLDPEGGGAEGLPDSEEYVQILEELRTA